MNKTRKLCGAAAMLAGALVGLTWALMPLAAAGETPPELQGVGLPCPSCPGGGCPFRAQTRPAVTGTEVSASTAIERPVLVYGRQRWRPLQNLIQRIQHRRHVTPPQPQPSPSPLPPIPPIPPLPPPAAGLTAVVFEDSEAREAWQGVVDKYAEDTLRDKDGTSHYRRYDVSVLNEDNTPASVEDRWQIVKDGVLPQIVIEDSGKLLFAGPEPRTIAEFQALLRQYAPAAAGTVARPQPCVTIRVRLPLLRMIIRKARDR